MRRSPLPAAPAARIAATVRTAPARAAEPRMTQASGEPAGEGPRAALDRAQLDRWMAAAAEGDRAAIDPLFHALWPIVAGYTARMLGDRALGEDCAQDALVRLFGQLERYDRSRDALTWALTIATWQCRTARRRAQRRREDGEAAPELLVDGVVHAEDRELVRAALATLA